jgi:hypothetical protein
MLGVASTAPNFPMQGQQDGQYSAQPGMSAMGNGKPAPAGLQGGTVPQQQQGYAAGYPGNYQGGYADTHQGNYSMGTPPVQLSQGMPYQQYPTGSVGMQQMPGSPGMTDEQRARGKPAKRGLFEAIRNLFFRQ